MKYPWIWQKKYVKPSVQSQVKVIKNKRLLQKFRDTKDSLLLF